MTEATTAAPNLADLLSAGINLGYGNCKVATDNGLFKYTSDFNRAASRKLQDKLGLVENTTQLVTWNNRIYEVGEGACLTSAPRRRKTIYERWAGTEPYMVLMQSILDRLAQEGRNWAVTLGVPIEEMKDDAYTDKVRRLWLGRHETVNGPVEIHAAAVVAEPSGALFYYGTHMVPIQTLRHQNLTICDWGYGTTLITTHHRLTIDEDNTAHIDRGVGKVIEHAAALLRDEYREMRDVVEVEMAMLKRWPLCIGGNEIDVGRFISAAVDVEGGKIISRMKMEVPRPATDMFCIGGGIHLFGEQMQKEYADHNVIIAEDPQDVNAWGLKLISDQRRAQITQAAAA